MCLVPLCIVPCGVGVCCSLCSAMAWLTAHVRVRMWAYAVCVCNKYTTLPRRHLPRTDHIKEDDAISPQLMVLKWEMTISQIKQQPGNYAWLLTQRSHPEKRYERRMKICDRESKESTEPQSDWVWRCQESPHQHLHLCPGQTASSLWVPQGDVGCLCKGQNSSTLGDPYLRCANLNS